MALEIEFKYLVDRERWEKVTPDKGVRIVQGYIASESGKTVRVRIKGKRGFLTVKGPSNGPVREEFEYEVPFKDAEAMLASLCPSTVEKTRYETEHEGRTWEIDVFEAKNVGLIVAEIELQDADEKYPLPEWVTTNVTDDKRYSNKQLSIRPFSSW